MKKFGSVAGIDNGFVTSDQQDYASLNPSTIGNSQPMSFADPAKIMSAPAPELQTIPQKSFLQPSLDNPAGGGLVNGGFDIGLDPEGDVTSSAYFLPSASTPGGDLYAGVNGDSGNYLEFGSPQVFDDNFNASIQPGGDAYAIAVNNDMTNFINGPGPNAQVWQAGLQVAVSDYNILGEQVAPGPGDVAAGFNEFAIAAGKVGYDLAQAAGAAGGATAAAAAFADTGNLRLAAASAAAVVFTFSKVNDAISTFEQPLSANEQAAISSVWNSAANAYNEVGRAAENIANLGGATQLAVPGTGFGLVAYPNIHNS